MAIIWTDENREIVYKRVSELQHVGFTGNQQILLTEAQKTLPKNLHRNFSSPVATGEMKLYKAWSANHRLNNGHAPEKATAPKNDDVPMIGKDEIRKLIQECFTICGGTISWKKIKAEHAGKWETLIKWSDGKMSRINTQIATMRMNGMIPDVAGLPKKPTKKPKTEIAAPVVVAAPPAPTLNYCPHCAFPIGAVIKAVNAVHLTRRS